jgi:hypothetical protein
MSNRLGRDPLVLAAGVLIPVLAVILFLLVR